jgi:hypothetical protein
MIFLLAGFDISKTGAITLSVVFGPSQLLLGLSGGLFVPFPDNGRDAKAGVGLSRPR